MFTYKLAEFERVRKSKLSHTKMEREDLGYYAKKQQKDMHDVSKYVDLVDLPEGYYKVKSFSIIYVKKQIRVRVDLKDNIFIIIPKENTDFCFLGKDICEWNRRNMMMHRSLALDRDCRVHFYDRIKKRPLCHTCSKLQDVTAFADGKYNVLSFSILKINDEDRIRVDVTDNLHFILPNDRQMQINSDNIEFWNKHRMMVKFDGPSIRFYCEYGGASCLKYQPTWLR